MPLNFAPVQVHVPTPPHQPAPNGVHLGSINSAGTNSHHASISGVSRDGDGLKSGDGGAVIPIRTG